MSPADRRQARLLKNEARRQAALSRNGRAPTGGRKPVSEVLLAVARKGSRTVVACDGYAYHFDGPALVKIVHTLTQECPDPTAHVQGLPSTVWARIQAESVALV